MIPLPADLPQPEPAASLPTPAMLRETAAYIASVQRADGEIPWESGSHTDVWDHVECAMALGVTGEYAAADAAFAWLRATQRADGTWPTKLQDGVIEESGADTNQCTYVAVGVWHHWLVRRDRAFVESMWPTVRAALDFAVTMQLPFGGFSWAFGEFGPATTALVTGSSSIHHALQCGERLADLLGEDASAWRGARERVAVALQRREEEFEPKRRFSMDWYYPALGGALTGDAAYARIEGRWEDFVVPGLGILCVDDAPWVTGAETCELALALEGMGDRARAERLVLDMQHLRDPDGSYHTGYVYADGKRWPIERSTWTGAAVILACDALLDLTPGAEVFRP
ncbi:MAG: prenyltransferase [Micrococcales bacterium]|nr:prenyltransferase [Micrococcales bacterium]